MEIKEKFLSVDNCENGDIITFVDEGAYATIETNGKTKEVINFNVDNGRYNLTYTPGNAALKELMKAWGRETSKWLGKKFSVNIVNTMAFGKPSKMILPSPIA